MSRLLREFYSAFVLIAASFAFFIFAYVMKRQLYPSPILFYEGITVAAVTASIFCLSYFMLTYAAVVDGHAVRSAIFLLLGSFSLNYSFVITFPTLLERSISVTLLSVVDQAPGGKISIQNLNDEFIRIYVAGDAQTRRRVEEQVATGNFQTNDGYVGITPRGRRFVSTFRFMATVFNVSRTYVDAKSEK